MGLTTLASEPESSDSGNESNNARWAELLDDLTRLRSGAEQFAQRASSSQLAPTYLESARNLLHYLYLRRHDLRPLQLRLASQGLSSLGRCESHAMHSLNAPIRLLRQLCELPDERVASAMDLLAGRIALEEHTTNLLGPAPPDRQVRIMVTMPGEAVQQPSLIKELLLQGMDCMRINCAHDNPAIWQALIGLLRQAESDTGKRCRVMMDLAGPKLRTGVMESGPAVCKVRPLRDATGHVLAPARVWITSQDQPQVAPHNVQASLQVNPAWLRRLRTGHRIRFRDARQAKRILIIQQVCAGGCLAESPQTAYFTNQLTLQHGERTTSVVGIPSRAAAIHLARNDTLILTRDPVPGQDAVRTPDGTVLEPAHISCTLPQVFNDLIPGQTVWFDDGKLGGIIESVNTEQVCVRIQHVRQQGASLRADKGINFPDTPLSLSALTEVLTFCGPCKSLTTYCGGCSSIKPKKVRNCAHCDWQPDIRLRDLYRRVTLP